MTLELVSPLEHPAPGEPFYLIVADFDQKHFCVEGPMTDDSRWNRAAARASEYHRSVQCGPKGQDRRSLSMEFQKSTGFGGVPPGSILRTRE
jgi:hypothetical protein